jgi:pimeloyl-ACP methyl ester carboxylesterase
MAASLLSFTERGAGPPLLLVHGLMITGEMFEPVLDHFAARHRVIVPDLRGHGRSRALPPPYTVERLARDLADLLNHIGVDTVDVLGYSNGGAVVQQFVLDHPGRCHRLVLACTYAFNMATVREQIEGRIAPVLVRALGMPRFARLVMALGVKHLSAERAAWIAGLIGSQDTTLMIAAWRAAMAFDSRARLGEIACPTLVLAGAADKGVPMHHARELHEGIAHSRLVVIDGADHAMIWADPDRFAREVDAFLASPAAAVNRSFV